MAAGIIMPKQGLQMTEGTIIVWHKKEGDTVVSGEPLFEIETDKLTIEIDAGVSGTLLKILKWEGDVVPVAETIAVIGKAGEDISSFLECEDKHPAPAAESSTQARPIFTQAEAAADSAGFNPAFPAASGGRIFSSPRARGLAGSRGLDLSVLKGTGPEGLVIERDVLACLSQMPKATPLARKLAGDSGVPLLEVQGSGPRGKIYTRDLGAAQAAMTLPAEMAAAAESSSAGIVRPLSPMRKVIARRMRESLDTAAQAVHRITVDMSGISRVRDKHKEAGTPVSYNDLIIKAVALTLRKHPVLNSRITSEGIVEMSQVNIGMAVAVPDGLVVPVLKNADLKPVTVIHAEAKKLGEAVRNGELQEENITGGTFTVSNLGMYGLDSFTAIINQPESGILAVGAVRESAVVIAGEIAVRPVCELSLTYDHRIVDGAPAAEFLRDLKNALENPYLMI